MPRVRSTSPVRSATAALALALGIGPAVEAQEPAAPADPLVRFSPHDVDGDGVAEIRALRWFGEVGGARAPLVVVFVEERLLRAREGVDPLRTSQLRQRLDRFAADLATDGFRARLVATELHAGERHQDGKTVLALRRVLQACRAGRELAGAILVGHFPDALLLRTCNWRRSDAVELRDADGKPVALPDGTPWLRRVTELVAHRCDLVLADLDGDWEGRYREERTEYPGILAAFGGPVPDGGGECTAWRPVAHAYADAFHLDDGAVTFDPATRRLAIDDGSRDRECTAADRALGNPLAQPEIAVSRLDARGIALRPIARLLDENGRPRAATFADGEAMPAWHDVFEPDPELELRLLCEYLDRNHRWRTTPRPPAHDKPASIGHGLPSGMRELRRTFAAWSGFDEAGHDLEGADLCALVEWLRRPAVLRTLRAHSDGRHAAFAATDAGRLEALVGGAPWSFTARGRALVPSLHACAHRGAADWFLYHTLWRERALPDVPYLLVHTGCEAISPPGADRLPYDHPHYGRRGQAEALLFFTPCLALVGRAKVFYDEPRGFCRALGAGATFGDAWRRYFAIEAAAQGWNEVGGDIGRKRAAFWSLLGDFTLRLAPVETPAAR